MAKDKQKPETLTTPAVQAKATVPYAVEHLMTNFLLTTALTIAPQLVDRLFRMLYEAGGLEATERALEMLTAANPKLAGVARVSYGRIPAIARIRERERQEAEREQAANAEQLQEMNAGAAG